MATISLTIPNDMLAKYLAYLGTASLDDAIVNLIRLAMDGEEDSDDGNERLSALSIAAMKNGELTEFLNAARKLATGTEFTTDALISCERWEAMSATTRRLIGKAFLVEVESQKIAEKIKVNSANKAIYRRL